MCFNQRGDISTLNGSSLKLVNKFTNLESSVSSTETDISMRLAKELSAIDRQTVIRKSDLTDKMKRSFFQDAFVSILLYGCTIWTQTIRMEKKLDGNYTRMLRDILNKSWTQYPTKQQLYVHFPLITETIQVRRIRHAGHCWRTHKRQTPVNPFTLTIKGRTTNSNLYTIALCRYRMLNMKTCWERWAIKVVAREGQGDLCWQRDMRMIVK